MNKYALTALLALWFSTGLVPAHSEENVPRLIQEAKPKQDPLFVPIPDDANTVVGFGANCMTGDESNGYALINGMKPALLGFIPKTDHTNSIGLFADAKGRLQVMIGDSGKGRVCVLTILEDVVFFGPDGQPITTE